MTTVLCTSAPGKIILCGEYAVLDGAPAICMAVDRRARVTLTERPGETFEVTAPGYSERTASFKVSDGDLDWDNAAASLDLVESVWRAADVERIAAQAIELDTTEFVDSAGGTKVGIGSSAAITVALSAALKNSVDTATIGSAALRAHTRMQGGAGSGVDIACSLHGGLIEYRMEGSSVTELGWPENLYYRIVWTGSAASTVEKLARLDAVVSLPSRVRLAGASEAMAAAWRNANATKILEGYGDYCETLYEFSVDHDLGIFDAGHKELRRSAHELGLIYKPCGAGGGDVGIALGVDDAALGRFADNLTPDHVILDVRLDPAGVRVEASATG